MSIEMLQPVRPSHRVIDAVFVPIHDGWYLLYSEQRNGHGYIWQQKLNSIFHTNNRLQHSATQVFCHIRTFNI